MFQDSETRILMKQLDSSDSGMGRDGQKRSAGDADSGTVTEQATPIPPSLTVSDTQQIIANLMDFKASYFLI